MATITEAASTYSFIGPFQTDKVLAPYDDNALPLFAVALHLDVEDLSSFATESLTDHPSDKKADIIYINEAESVACVAQGSTFKDWAKQAALANKASDLNTAAAWLLQTPINDVPDVIRPHAKLLRDGLNQKTIKRLIFAYAHNALESTNVEDELQTVRHLLSALDIVKGVTVEVVELGLRRIEALYLTSRGSIQVTDDVVLPAQGLIHQTGPGWEAYALPLNGTVLFDLYEAHGRALFSANLRDFLGARNDSRNVNNRIKQTAEANPGEFFVLNNGITMITKKAIPDAGAGVLRICGVSVVNGAQTTGAVHEAGKDHAKNISVLARIIVVAQQEMISKIVAGNNTQNSIVAWDRRSNDPVQIRIQGEFKSRGVDYIHRRDSTRKLATSLSNDQVGQMMCAFGGDLQTAIRAKAEIFESDATYNAVFPHSLSIGHIYAIQTLGWAYDSLKQQLKTKAASGNMTDIEVRQLRLLDFPASKQFLICVVGKLREEIAGRKLTNPKALELKTEFITPAGQVATEAWTKVLKVILPIVVQSLPAEEYQVVRSTEHTDAVAKISKGVLAGLLTILQDSFTDLQNLLKPV